MIAADKPAVVIATELFGKLAKVTLTARNLPQALGIVLRGNPEFLDETTLAGLADKALDEAVKRLTSGAGSVDQLVG